MLPGTGKILQSMTLTQWKIHMWPLFICSIGNEAVFKAILNVADE